MVRSKRKGLFTLFTGICIILTMLFVIAENSGTAASAEPLSSGSWDDYRDTEMVFTLESGNSASDPYIISSAEQLARLSYEVNYSNGGSGNSFINKYFLQTANIDLSANYFTPIGFENKEFAGIYNGGGFMISGLYIDKPDNFGIGLFGNVDTTVNLSEEAGTIRNVNTVSGTIAGKGNTGSIVGSFLGKRIEHCSSGLTLNQGNGTVQSIGGIVGLNYHGIIESCYFIGEIIAADAQNVGGIAGINGYESSTISTISECFNIGNITASESTGGISGTNYVNIQNCYNSGDIISDINVGGLVGYNAGNIVNSYVTGIITAGTDYVGAIVGQNVGILSNLYYNKNNSKQSITSGSIGVENGGIAAAVDDLLNNVLGLNYFDMFDLDTMPLSDTVWAYIPLSQVCGFTPYIISNGVATSELSQLTLYSGTDITAGNWGEADNPYGINLPEQFSILSENINNNGITYQDKFFKLENSIDFSGLTDFSPIGNVTNHFSGALDGNNCTLSNLSLSLADADYTGLFGYIENAEALINIVIENFDITGKDFTGTLAGYLDYVSVINGVTVSNSTVNGNDYNGGIFGYCGIVPNNITNLSSDSEVSGENYTGGLIGYGTASSLMRYSHNIGTVNGTDYVGGILGYSNYNITLCYNAGDITGTDYVGGILGYGNNYLSLSYNTGDVTGNNYNGGNVGQGSGLILSENFNHGNVTGSGLAGYTGGLVGRATNSYILECYQIGNINGTNFVGGLAGEFSSGIIRNSYIAGEIEFDTYGATIANTIGSVSFENNYYNSDFINGGAIFFNGTGKNTVELTNGFASTISSDYYISESMQGLYGYYPQLKNMNMSYTDISRESTKYYYFDGGDGLTATSPYSITESIHLFNMQRLIASCGNYYNTGDTYYSLGNDITLENEFTPIASLSSPFLGEFDGNYNSIYNLNINLPDSVYVGLFSYLGSGSYVRKTNIMPVVTVETSYGSVTGKYYVGAIAGYSLGYIWDCMNSIDVTGENYIGGIAGGAVNIARSCNTGAVSGGSSVGGITGFADGSIQQCFNSGYIKCNIDNGGGIAGTNTNQINICYNSGDIGSTETDGTYTGTLKGGITGLNYESASISNCYNIGNLKGELGFTGGGIVGMNGAVNIAQITNAYFNNEVAVGFSAIGSGTAGSASVKGLTTVEMVGNTALSSMVFSAGYFVASEGRTQDADFAPQLIIFKNKTVAGDENAAIIPILQEYSEQSVMLRLFGRDVYNRLDWGTEDNPYLVETFDHLDTLRKQVDAGYTFVGYYFLVTKNIDMENKAFLPIGYYNNNDILIYKLFEGIFDGDGYIISNLTVGSVNSEISEGLFGYTGTNAIIKNVIVGSGAITGYAKVGSIVGYSQGLITRCYSSATVIGTTSVGGIAGQLKSNQITYSLFDGVIEGNSDRGGLLGKLENASSVVLYSWHILDINASFSNDIGSRLYIDKNGTVQARVDKAAVDNKDFIYFELLPNSGFGFDIRNISDISITFAAGGIDGSLYYPMYNTIAASGYYLNWFARFTKTVTVVAQPNGSASGTGSYYEGQNIIINVVPDLGYRLDISNTNYNYAGDGETISCTRTMGNVELTYTPAFIAFGNGATEILNPEGIKAQNGDEFSYDGNAKTYIVNINGFTSIVSYIRNDLDLQVENAINAISGNTYTLVVKLQEGNVIVGIKKIDFYINPHKITLITENLSAPSYTEKQYDKYSYNEVEIGSEVYEDLIFTSTGDEITLTAVRRYLDSVGNPDANIGSDKFITYNDFEISGIDAGNYSIPDVITDIPGSIIKRNAYVNILATNLTKQYDGNIPSIVAHSFDGDLGDNLFVNEFSFTRLDGEPSEGWNKGVYVVGLTENISGNKDNYNILLYTDYYYDITPKIISTIVFSGHENLAYTAAAQNSAVSARYALSANTFAYADLTFYHNNEIIAEIVDAGSYLVKASISDENFALDSEKSISFTISKINQPDTLVLTEIEDTTFATETINLETTGGNGNTTIVFEVLKGAATISGNILTVNGTGDFELIAIMGESTNYYEQQSAVESFRVSKLILKAVLTNQYISYGDNPVIEISYTGYARGEQGKSDVEGLVEPDSYLLEENLTVNVEGYDIYLRDNGLADGYIIDISEAEGKLFIQRKELHISAAKITKIYGSADPEITYTILEGNNIALFGNLNRAAGENTGNYLIEQNTLTSENNTNYDITFIPNYFTILVKDLRVSIPVMTKIYGTSDPAVNFVINQTDLKLGDNFSVLTGTITRELGEEVGQYAYKYTNVSAGRNYTVRFTEVRYLKIEKSTPYFVAAPRPSEISYGDTLADSIITGEANVPGIFLWKNTSILPTVSNSEVTSYEASFIPSDSGNYNSLSYTLKVRVLPRKTTVAFIGTTELIYDGTDRATLSGTAANILAGDEVIVNISYSSNYIVDVGSYTATANINNINYIIDGGLTKVMNVYKRELNISVKNATVTEGEKYTTGTDINKIADDEFTLEIVYSGFKGMDDVNSLTTIAEIRNIPTKAGVHTITPEGAAAKNYKFKYISGTLTINKKMIADNEITVKGSLPPDTTVTLLEMNTEGQPFVAMTSFVDTVLNSNAAYKDYILQSFSSLSLSENITGELEYTLAVAAGNNNPLIIKHIDGSMEIISEYEYDDGFATFTSSNVSGIGVLREASFYEKYKYYILFEGIGLIAAIAIALYFYIKSVIKEKKERETPVYYN